MEEQLSLPIKLSGIHVVPETTDFALLQFDQTLDPLQQKLFYMTLACVDKGEDPEAQMEYQIDIRRMAEFSGVDSAGLRRNMESAVSALNEMDLKLRPVIEEEDKIHFLFGIYQELTISKLDPYLISVRLNYRFRKQVLKMKKEYDIEYPTKTILQLDGGKYTIPLYTFLIAETARIRESRDFGEAGNVYVIRVSKDALLQRLNYTSQMGAFNNRILPTAIREINEHSEVYVENDMPELIKKGRTVLAYEFRVHVTTTIEKPIFARSLIHGSVDLVPEMDYLVKRMREMKVAESSIKRWQIQANPDRLRIWGNMLYTWAVKGFSFPKYFRASYDHNWFEKETGNELSRLFRLVMTDRPEIADDYMKAIDDEYTKRGIFHNPHFMEELAKRILKYRQQ